jgi:hypothetical protein
MASENNNRLDDILARAIGREKREPDFAKWQQEHPQAVQMLKSQATRQTRPRRLLDIGRIIMRSPISKLAAAAMIIVAVVVSISVFNKSMPTAFGIEQVIAASDNIRFLHAKQYRPNQEKPNEFWIKSDEQGRVVKARYYLPVTDDGVKLITWSPEGTELWFKSKRWLALIQTKRIAGWMQSILEQCQPKLVMEKLLEDQKAGKVDIDIQKPAVIVATYKSEPKKEIYYVNRKTDLITHVESYRIEGDREVLKLTTQFSEYNVPIDEKMFSLRDEVPKDVKIADRLNQICGVPQENMTDEQAAAETVRQYLQALIDKDYKKAGLICCGMLEKYAKEDFGWCDVNAILSIGPPIPQPNWRKHGFQVPFELEILARDGQKTAYKSSQYVSPGDDEMHPDRWNITSGGLERTEKELEVLPDNEKHEKMTPKEVAETFLKACAEENLDKYRKFWPMSAAEKAERTRAYFFGLKIISVGEPFQKDDYPGWFVPYEVKFKDGRAHKNNLAVRNDNPAKLYIVDGGF